MGTNSKSADAENTSEEITNPPVATGVPHRKGLFWLFAVLVVIWLLVLAMIAFFGW